MDRQRRNRAVRGESTFAHIDHMQQRLDGFHRDAERRRKRMDWVWSEIERALGKLLATPMLQNDLHCRALVQRLARAGDPQNFADRVTDLHIHIMDQAAQKSEAGELDTEDEAARFAADRRAQAGLRFFPDAGGSVQELGTETPRRILQL